MTPTGQGAKKSAAPVGNNVGKAHDMYPSLLNSLMGVYPLEGHEIHTVSLNLMEEDTESPSTQEEDKDLYVTHSSGSFIPSTRW